VPDRHIPDEVLALLQERLAGLDELEVLLFVRRDATQRWTASAIAKQLGRPESSTESALESLQGASLAVADGGGGGAEREFSYGPATTDLEAAVTLLADLYRERPLDVMRILSNSALDRIRSAAARTFADAFLIGRNGRKKDG
jgi:hypothetical protein